MYPGMTAVAAKRKGRKKNTRTRPSIQAGLIPIGMLHTHAHTHTPLEGTPLRIRIEDANSLDRPQGSLRIRVEFLPLSFASRVAEVVGPASLLDVFGDLLPAYLDQLLFEAHGAWV